MSHTLTDTTAMPGMVFTIDTATACDDTGFTIGTTVRVVGNTVDSAADHDGHTVRHEPRGYPHGTHEVAWSIVDDGDGVLVTTRDDWMNPRTWEEGVTAYVHVDEMTPVLLPCDRHRDFGFHLHYNNGGTHSNMFYDSPENGAARRRERAFFAPAHMVNTVFGGDGTAFIGPSSVAADLLDLARRGVSQPVTPAEHGSRPDWPIYPCEYHSYQTRPHYHVTNTGQEDGSGGTGHNSTVYEGTSRHTVQGKRFQPGAPEPVNPLLIDEVQPPNTVREIPVFEVGARVELREAHAGYEAGTQGVITDRNPHLTHPAWYVAFEGPRRWVGSGPAATYERRLRLVSPAPSQDVTPDHDLVLAQDHTLRRTILLNVIAAMDSVDEQHQQPTEDQYERAIRDAVNW